MYSTLVFSLILLSLFQFAKADFDPNLAFISKVKYEEAKSKVGHVYGARDGAEMEMTYKFICTDTNTNSLDLEKSVFKTLSKNNYEKFKKLSKCKNCEAMSAYYSVLHMPWDKTAHAVRMNMGYTPMSVENERLSPETYPSPIKLSYGADLMDDVYFDTDEYIAGKNLFGLRARKRWDSANTLAEPLMRRILVGLKATEPVDLKTGLKTALKIDDRYDRPSSQQIASFVSEVPTGLRETAPIPSVLRLYEGLSALGLLKDEGDHAQVLQLKPKTFLRSYRMRFHYGSLSVNKMKTILNFSHEVIEEIKTAIAGIDVTKLSPEDSAQLQKISVLIENLKSKEAMLTASGLQLNDYLVENKKIVDFSPGTYPEIDETHVATLTAKNLKDSISAAEVVAKMYIELGRQVEINASIFAPQPSKDKEAPGLKRVLSFIAQGNDLVPLAARSYDQVMEREISKIETDPVTAKTVVVGAGPYTQKINETLENLKKTNPEIFNEYKPYSEKQILDSLAFFKFNRFEESGRQIEYAATAIKGFTYMAIHTALVESYYDNSNLFIDTTDIVGMFKAQPLEVDEYSVGKADVPPVRKEMLINDLTNNHVITENAVDKSLIGSYISNDVQLELGLEKPYLTALKTHAADPEKVALINWMLNQIHRFQKMTARLKVININNFIDKNDVEKAGCKTFSWKPTDMPKGETSVKKLIEMEIQ